MKANFSYPTEVRFGSGRLAEVAEVCKAAGMARPLVVTDRGLAGQDFVAEARRRLGAAALFSGVGPNPDDQMLQAGLAVYRAGGHDGVVAIGGGSAMDLGKIVAFMAGQRRPVWDFEDVGDWWTRAKTAAIAPVVAVPTTAGTGSEVGRAGVLTNSAKAVKKIIFHPRMLPVTVIADPTLTVGLPPAMTAGTGMDALAHCLEAYSSPAFHPMSQGIALEGMALVKDNLPRACTDGSDLGARGAMMAAAMMGAVAFQKGLGAIHALSHPVGAVHGVHHGTCNAVLMETVLRFNRAAIEARLERAGAYLGITGGFDGFVDWVTDLKRQIGIPESLSALGVADPDLDRLAQMSVADPTAGGNPLPLTVGAARDMLAAAL